MVAPSGPLQPERIARGTAKLASFGLRVIPGSHLDDRHQNLSYLAGDDHDRAADFMATWTDPAVRAVWCARGGYGAQRMVDLLDFERLRAAGPKHLIGFSDITALHTRIGRELDQVTIHGPTAASRQLDDRQTAEHLLNLLFETPASGTELLAGDTVLPGIAQGTLVGGNLALVTADLGVESPPVEPSIAVFEDVGECGYRLDRMLTQLRRSGWFTMVRGVVLGDFSETDHAGQLQSLLEDRLNDLEIPILHHVPVGHDDRNLALPLGSGVVLDGSQGVVRLV